MGRAPGIPSHCGFWFERTQAKKSFFFRGRTENSRRKKNTQTKCLDTALLVNVCSFVLSFSFLLWKVSMLSRTQLIKSLNDLQQTSLTSAAPTASYPQTNLRRLQKLHRQLQEQRFSLQKVRFVRGTFTLLPPSSASSPCGSPNSSRAELPNVMRLRGGGEEGMESEVEVEEVVKEDDEDRVASPRYVPRMMQQEVRKKVKWISLYGMA